MGHALRYVCCGALILGAGACTETAESVESAAPVGVDEADPSEVDGVLFLIGDAGNVEEGHSPLIVAIRRDVEHWAGALADSSVAVVFLGDNVYESGIRNPDHIGYATDTLRMNTQVRIMTGPNASAKHVRGVFLPGNHDWGNTTGERGLARARNMERHLRNLSGDSAAVAFLPDPGTPGPAIVDVGSRIRVLGMDGHWWLQNEDRSQEREVLGAVEAAIREAGDRRVVVASHLPIMTGGPHGGTISFLPTLGIRYLAHKSGVLVQDVTSRPYKRLIAGMYEAAATAGAPVAFAAGHDHSLQVLTDTVRGGQAITQLVSGAGSKVTAVRDVPGMRWARMAPGYMRLTFLRNGEVHLHVVAGAVSHLSCHGMDPVEIGACMAAGSDSIHVPYAQPLR